MDFMESYFDEKAGLELAGLELDPFMAEVDYRGTHIDVQNVYAGVRFGRTSINPEKLMEKADGICQLRAGAEALRGCLGVFRAYEGRKNSLVAANYSAPAVYQSDR